MNRKMLLAVVLALMLASVAVAASAGGHTTGQLETAGWFCTIAGPHGWNHCFKPGFDPTAESQIVKVFTADGSTFLGTELLLRADLYHDQPCAQDGGGKYEELTGVFPVTYMACHHFATP